MEKINKDIRVKNKLIFFLAIFVVVIFFWIFVRPTIIRSYCYSNFKSTDGSGIFIYNGRAYSGTKKQTFYNDCLLKFGMMSEKIE